MSIQILSRQATHAQRLERWLGAEMCETLAFNMRDWYGPPIAVAGVPGAVFVTKGGDFRGEIRDGFEASWKDYARDFVKRMNRGVRVASRANQATFNAGFASLSDLIAEATGGKQRIFQWQKAGPTGVVGVTSSLWRLGAQPVAGGAPGAAPGGTAHVDSDGGGHVFANPTGGDTQHIVSATVMSDRIGQLLLYDRLFGVVKTMNSTSNESVTGVPSRYQNTTSGNADSADGNFLAIEVGGTALAATAHNWDTNLYTDQNGNTGAALPTVTGNSAGIVDRLDQPANTWFCPLASGDVGIKALTQMHCSAAVATGVIWFVVGHPIAWIPCPIINNLCQIDTINTAFNLARIFDDACLALYDVQKAATNATNWNLSVVTVAG